MMKPIIFTCTLLLASAATGEAMADCSTNRVAGGNALRDLLRANTICVPEAGGGWNSQEEHHANGELWDYKLGNNDPVDPRKQVGTWSATNGANARVSYIYFGSPDTPSGPFQVYLKSGNLGEAGSIYDFCTGSGGAPVVTGTLKGARGGCS